MLPQVGCLLNYSAEASVAGSVDERGVDEAHVVEAIKALYAVAQFDRPGSSPPSQPTAPYTIKPTLLAIKLTGLIFDPTLLSRATNALVNSSSHQRGTPLPRNPLFPESPELSGDDELQLEKLYEALRSICAKAQEGGVRLLIDAEQSWFQPA
jgi:proline dehydrogenase